MTIERKIIVVSGSTGRIGQGVMQRFGRDLEIPCSVPVQLSSRASLQPARHTGVVATVAERPWWRYETIRSVGQWVHLLGGPLIASTDAIALHISP